MDALYRRMVTELRRAGHAVPTSPVRPMPQTRNAALLKVIAEETGLVIAEVRGELQRENAELRKRIAALEARLDSALPGGSGA